MSFGAVLRGISTLITVDTPSIQTQGTGFFYQEPGSANLAEDEEWPDQLYVVTNRHVVLPEVEGSEVLPSSFTFYLRRLEDGEVEWAPVVLDQRELIDRLKLHPDPSVDVAVVDVLNLMRDQIMAQGDYLKWYGISEKQLPGEKGLSVEVTDDALVIGYPREFYDEHNLFPIVKSGIIASNWGDFLDGQPYFLIDAKLFPGSSGSIVISKPKDIRMTEEEGGDVVNLSDDKEFAFLGIYSGDPYWQEKPIELDDMTIIRKLGFDVGIVWYAQLVGATITDGVPYSP